MPPDPFWFLPAAKMLAALGLLAAAFWPWTTRILAGRPDRGAGWAVPGGLLGFLICARLLWQLGGGPMEPGRLWLWVAIVAGTGWKIHRPFAGSDGTRSRMRSAGLRAAFLFSLLFIFWAGIRASDPGLTHTEQPMDLMWMRAAMVSEGPPLRDAWLGHAPATYYAGGHQALAFLSALIGEPARIGYALGQITWFALCGLVIYLTVPMVIARRQNQGGGLLGVLLLLFASTLPGIRDALQPPEGLWWWGASRVIHENGWDLITEFPFFSFWLGDNHAHLLGLPMLVLAGAASLFLRQARRLTFAISLPAGLALVWSLLINPWQVPTVLALISIGLISRSRFPSTLEIRNLLAGLLLPLVLALPLTRGPFQGIVWEVPGHTNLIEAMKVFGIFLPGLIGLYWLPRSRWLWLTVLLCAGLFATCEVLRVADAFQNRLNTVFKVYYQLWILCSLLSTAGWTALLRSRWRPLALLSLLLPALGCLYAARLCGAALASPRRGLDPLQVESPAFRTRILVADRLIQAGDRIAEAPGNSYQPRHSHLGTWTAGANIIGWVGHQQQWRPRQPLPSVDALYTAQDPATLFRLLRELDVQWVWVGPHERERYALHPDLPRWLDRDFNRVIDQPEGVLWQIL